MTVLFESIDVPRSPRECFAYISDFTTTVEWDSTAQKAEKLTDGPIGVGTRFLVNCALPVGSVDLDYEVTRYEPDELFELTGRCRWFTVEDSIRFTRSLKGTRIDYRAEFTFAPGLSQVAGLGRSGMERMGKESLAGMEAALTDDFELPQQGAGGRLADKLVLPGLGGFTRLGYRRGLKRWNPMSAYMGDKHVVLTGASTGLGYASAMQLARRGASLTLVMRNPEKAERVVRDITEATGNTEVRAEIADLSLLADVDALSQRLLAQGRAIDVLINNAGALYNERADTAEGLEQSVALLLLSPYRLTLALKPLLDKAGAARVINVVSGGMYSQPLNVALLQDCGDDYNGAVQYARAKRALMVVTEEWAEAWGEAGIAVNAMHPGWADTPGVVTSLPRFHQLMRKVLRTPEEGADTIVWLAVATEAAQAGGQLWLDREPHSTHLLKRTQERSGEREALQEWLQAFNPPADKPRRRARR